MPQPPDARDGASRRTGAADDVEGQKPTVGNVTDPPTSPGSYTPYSEQSIKRLLAFAAGVGLAGYLLHLLAGAFPAHPKTLARDAAVVGFIGAVLVIGELVRRAMQQVGRIALVVALFAAVFAISAQLNAIAPLVSVIVVAIVSPLVMRIGRHSFPAIGSALKSIPRADRIGPPLREYGPTAFGVALLVLALFLQLRSINLA